ncbi:uncharacterized protein CXorf65 homolog [Pomacea canaliculata]|uniref:uncharacterized protein CXorf65 homolog n=1 Tax=Pomacea canaliculata TaxID=400727 RepID=UPI000D73A2CA|nr:uncharacterized protein CXorf65 homolog [Pomacea canaliculata]
MFIRIKYGDHQMMLVNTDCQRVHFEEYVRKQCPLNKKEVLDLCDQTGQLVGLPSKNLSEYVSTCTQERKIYFPIALRIGRPNHQVKEVRPMVKNFAKRFPDLMENLDAQTASSKPQLLSPLPRKKAQAQQKKGKKLK